MFNQLLISKKSKGLLAKPELVIGKIDFSSNDFLGLARSRELYDEITERYRVLSEKYGPIQGASGSRLGSGHLEFVEILEQRLAEIHGFPEALVCHCGYMANQSICFLSASEKDFLIFDEGVHISLKSGVLLGKGKYRYFRHNDMESLEECLVEARSSGGNIFIGVSSVYSQDGSLAALDDLVFLSRKYGARLIVDEAHAIGVFGNGRGFTQNWSDQIFGTVVTFGKALGSFGAAILGGLELKEYLMNFAYPSRFSTALPLYNLVAVDCAYDFMLRAQDKREHLFQLRDYFSQYFVESGPGVVQSFDFGLKEIAIAFVDFFRSNGISLNPIPFPEISTKPGAVRISLHEYNTREEIDYFYRLYNTFFKEEIKKMSLLDQHQ